MCSWQRNVCTLLNPTEQKQVLAGQKINVEMWKNRESLDSFVSLHSYGRSRQGLPPLYVITEEDKKWSDADRIDEPGMRSKDKPKSKKSKAEAKVKSKAKAKKAVKSQTPESSSPSDVISPTFDFSAPISGPAVVSPASVPTAAASASSCRCGQGQQVPPAPLSHVGLDPKFAEMPAHDATAVIAAADPVFLADWAAYSAPRGLWVPPTIPLPDIPSSLPGNNEPFPMSQPQSHSALLPFSPQEAAQAMLAQAQAQAQAQTQTQISAPFFDGMLTSVSDPVLAQTQIPAPIWPEIQLQDPIIDTSLLASMDPQNPDWMSALMCEPAYDQDLSMKATYDQLAAAVAVDANTNAMW